MKKFIIAFCCIMSVFIFSGCSMNKMIIDTVYSYDYAYLKLPDGTYIEGPCKNWSDYEDGDQLQVTINGTTYLTHATNVVLVHSSNK